jgi:hypothetical protein
MIILRCSNATFSNLKFEALGIDKYIKKENIFKYSSSTSSYEIPRQLKVVATN